MAMNITEIEHHLAAGGEFAIELEKHLTSYHESCQLRGVRFSSIFHRHEPSLAEHLHPV